MARPWHRDPLVIGGILIAAATSAYVFFAGRYLPYDDWAGHVGLSAVLANGDETGADRFLARDFSPTPYLLFYLITAGWAQIVPAEVGAKLNLVIVSALLVVGAARLAEASGRSPRLALIAPLALFGAPLGLGFSSYVVATPAFFFVLADFERWLGRIDAGSDPLRGPPLRDLAFMSTGLALAFLGHGLLFLFSALAVVVRLFVFLLRRRPRTLSMRIAAASGLPFLLPTLLAIEPVWDRVQRPFVAPEFATAGGPAAFGWVPLQAHLSSVGSDLLDRGGDGHGVTALLVLIVFVAWIAGGRILGRTAGAGGAGLWVHAVLLNVVFWFGPVWAGWPVTFWVVYARAGSLAMLLVFLLPRVDLRGARGAALAALAFVPLIHNAWVNAEHVKAFSAWADAYDPIREAIPPRQRVLQLVGGGAVPNKAAATLIFYVLADGASYVPVGNIPKDVPVHRLDTPGTPYNPSLGEWNPSTVGRAYDYVILRGDALVATTTTAGHHELVIESEGWHLFKTR